MRYVIRFQFVFSLLAVNIAKLHNMMVIFILTASAIPLRDIFNTHRKTLIVFKRVPLIRTWRMKIWKFDTLSHSIYESTHNFDGLEEIDRKGINYCDIETKKTGDLEIIDLTPQNIADYGVCGYKDIKRHIELRREIDWFKEYYPKGLRIKALFSKKGAFMKRDARLQSN